MSYNTYFTFSQGVLFKFKVYRDRVQIFHASTVEKFDDCGHSVECSDEKNKHSLCLYNKPVLDIEKPQRILVHSIYEHKVCKYAQCLVQQKDRYILVSTNIYAFVLKDDYIVEFKVTCANGIAFTWAIGLNYVYVLLDEGHLKRSEKDVILREMTETGESDIISVYYRNDTWQPVPFEIIEQGQYR